MAANITKSVTFSMQDHVVVLALMSLMSTLRMVSLESGSVTVTNSSMKSATRRKFMLKCELSILSCSTVLEPDVMVNMHVICYFTIFLMTKKCGLLVK